MALLAPELIGSESGFQSDAFAQLAAAEDRSFWFRCRNRLLSGLISQYFPLSLSVLEIGCGNGVVLNALKSLRAWTRVVGSELHPEGLSFARARLPAEIELIQMDARRVPMLEEFDLIGAFDVLEHIQEDEDVLTEIKKALAPGGGAIIAVPQHPTLWSPADDYARHVRRYRRGELERKLERSGFRVLTSTSFVVSLLPAMAASRAFRVAQSAFREKVPTIVGMEVSCAEPLNRVFEMILNAEVGITLAGIRWPIGGSRIVAARLES